MSAALTDPAAWRDAGAYHAWYVEAARRSTEIQRINERRTGLSFGRWLKQVSPGWPWSAPHLVAVRRALARIERSETDRLMIFLHPRSYKSQMVTVRWPAYLLERDPLTRIIVGSYNQTLAESFSHETRRIVAERGIALDPKRQSVDHWLTAAGGGLRAVGVGGGVTGHGASILCLDDPVKNYEEANSRAYQERVWHWWQYDLQTRLEPHPRTGRPPAVVLTMTRWSENDLAGRILASEGGERWDVLRIPALAETQEERDDYAAGIGRPTGEPDPLGRQPGEAMDPARFPVTVLEEKRAEGLMAFMALYQNRPTAPAGDMFRREWFETVPKLPDGNRTLVRYWDKAGSTSSSSAYTAGVLMARIDKDHIASYYVVHAVMGRWGAAEREHVIRQTAAADFAAYGYDVETVVEQEPGSGGKESAENTIRELSSMGYRVAADRPTGDKVLRAEPLAAAAGVGRVKLVAGAWNRDYLDILAAFPGGAIKDTVDASSGGYIRLSRAEDKRPKSSTPTVVTAADMFD